MPNDLPPKENTLFKRVLVSVLDLMEVDKHLD